MEKAEGVAAEMREHLRLLRERGVDPYPRRWERTHLSSDVVEEFDELSAAEVAVAGRLTAIRGHGKAGVARMVRRSILTFQYREEKVVEGPTLQPLHRVQDVILEDKAVQAAIRDRAEERRIPIERARADARRMFTRCLGSSPAERRTGRH